MNQNNKLCKICKKYFKHIDSHMKASHTENSSLNTNHSTNQTTIKYKDLGPLELSMQF